MNKHEKSESKYMEMEDQHDKEIREALRKRTLTEDDIRRHTLDHKRDKDLQHIEGAMDSEY
jgi:hypothetical protein